MLPYRRKYTKEELERDQKLCSFLCTALIVTLVVCSLIHYGPMVLEAIAAMEVSVP